jgi:hypothetical protein
MQDAKNARVALAFGFGGLISGLTLAAMTSRHVLDFSSLSGGSPGHHPYFLLWPWAFLFISLSASIAICRNLRWLDINFALLRCLVAAILVISASFCATIVGVGYWLARQKDT